MTAASWRSLALLAGTLFSQAAAAQTPAGKCESVPGVLVGRKDPASDWRLFKENDPIPTDVLLVALPEANIKSRNGAVRLGMLADIGMRGPLPVFESALRIHDSKGVDLDLTLDRGIAVFTNLKKKGAAKVRVRFLDQVWDLTLAAPGTHMGLEIYGRHAPGIPKFITDEGKLKAADVPTMNVYLLVRTGHAMIMTGTQEIALDAPPGPAKIHWDSIARRLHVEYLDKQPPTLRPSTPEEMDHYKKICAFARELAERPLDDVLEDALKSADPVHHNGAVVCLAALDKVPKLCEVLGTSKYADARDRCIVVMRNWIGRGPGQVEKLYRFFVDSRKMTPVQTRTAIHLLYGFDDDEQRQPFTYEMLIDLLKHSKMGVREAARWHLVRLVPEGKKIDYDAGAPPEQRQRAIEQWRALVPTGQLPPKMKSKGDK
jgi:hypothetical protein